MGAKAVYIGCCVWFAMACLLMAAVCQMIRNRCGFFNWLAGAYLFGFMAFYLMSI